MPFPRMSERTRRPPHRRLRHFTPTTNDSDPRLPESHRVHPAGHPKKYWCICDGCAENGENGDARPGRGRSLNEGRGPRVLQSQGAVLDGHLRNCKYSPYFGWKLLPWESEKERGRPVRRDEADAAAMDDDDADGRPQRYVVEFDPSRPLGMWLEPISRTAAAGADADGGGGTEDGGGVDRRARGAVGEVVGEEATGTGCRVAGFDDGDGDADDGYSSQARESGSIRVGDVVASVDGRACLGGGFGGGVDGEGGGDGDGDGDAAAAATADAEFGDVVRWLKEALDLKRRAGGAPGEEASAGDGTGEAAAGGDGSGEMIRIEFVRRVEGGTGGDEGDSGAENRPTTRTKKRRRGRPKKTSSSAGDGLAGSPARKSPRRARRKRSGDGVVADEEDTTPDITSVLSPCQVNHLRRRPCTCAICGRADGSLPVCHFRPIPGRSNTCSGSGTGTVARPRGGENDDEDDWWSTEDICVHPYCGTMAKMEPFSSPKYEIWSVAAIAANFGPVPGYAEAISMTRRVLATSIAPGGGGGGGGRAAAGGARYCLLAEFHANLQWAAGPAFRPGAPPPPVVDLAVVVAPPPSSSLAAAAVVGEGRHEAGAGGAGAEASTVSATTPTSAGDELVRCVELHDAARGIDTSVLQNASVAESLNPAARDRLERVVASMRDEGRRILDAHPDHELSNFEQRFKLLVRYKIEKGDTLVPNLYEDRALRNFVNHQRTKYKNYSAGRAMVANDGWRRAYERDVELLNRVGFVWKAVEYKPWDEYFDELREFAEVHGHTRVPQIYQPNKSLAGWVHNQRKFYEQKMREGKKNCLNEEKIQRLESIGFQWKLRHGRPKKSDPRYSYKKRSNADTLEEEEEPTREESDPADDANRQMESPADDANRQMESIPFQSLAG